MITFVEFAASHGLLIDELFTDGSRHRVPTDDDKPGRLVSWSFLSWGSNPLPQPYASRHACSRSDATRFWTCIKIAKALKDFHGDE